MSAMIPPAAPLVLFAVATAAALALPAARGAQIFASPWAAPAPALDCAGAQRKLTPCLTYVERRSELTRPDKGCCGALAVVAGGDAAACFCALVAGYGYYGVRVDPARALALPTICRVAAPPPRLCAALGMPVAEPPEAAAAASPAESGSDGPATTPPAAANGGSATAQRHSSCRHFCRLALSHLFILSATLLLLL